MSQVSIDREIATLETASCSGGSHPLRNLRGVRWRIDLGILPSYSSASVDDLRRVTADSRRRYAALRRQLLVDPHVPKDGNGSPDRVMDNPLSQNPDSMWGRFFRNAELERMVDQDLTRLYPERGSYFQTSECQVILRRILLLWCLRHPEYGYGQGMHELLAPLLYVLHVDVEHLSRIKKMHSDHLADKFDGFSFHENDLTYKFDFKKFSESAEDGDGVDSSSCRASRLGELDPEVQTMVLLNDPYGAEGELGIVLSEKFMEHDAYSMFDSLMCGSGGSVAMAAFFSPPVIEASAGLYHLLSIVDPSLHSHLVELQVEPQYFALRWLRVLFGREFSLGDLLLIWDEIFLQENAISSPAGACDSESSLALLDSPRGAFICAFAVAMILNLRSSLLATENATVCLQRLLNFPDDVELVKLLSKAVSLLGVATDAKNFSPTPVKSEFYDRRKSAVARGHSLSLDLSLSNPLSVVPDSYWEERWRVLHKDEESKPGAMGGQALNQRKGWFERAESDPSSLKKNLRSKGVKPSVRRSLLYDLARQLGSEENEVETTVSGEDDLVGQVGLEEDENSSTAAESEDSSSTSADPAGRSPGDRDNVDESERSDASTSSVDEDDDCSLEPLPSHREDASLRCAENDEAVGKLTAGMNEVKHIPGRFHWLWKFGRNAGEGSSATEDGKGCGDRDEQNDGSSKGETVDQNLMVSFKNLGQSMIENIQVLECIFQQDRGQASENLSKNRLVGKGQVTATAALKELRKISNLLSEM